MNQKEDFTTRVSNLPTGSNTVNPFIMTDQAADLIDFLIKVFGALEVPEARTLDSDGLILHSELRIGDSMITVADRKPDWPFTPAFNRVYVNNVDATLARAVECGAQIVTKPTDFFGDVLARFTDPHGNLWWVYKHAQSSTDWQSPSGENSWAVDDEDASWESFSTPELEHIHTTLIQAMTSLRDPREFTGS
ncbi:MAG: VOC family protein [Corynebacteriales bacterium]|nr:VOC family protein [Mycobacteriales bacterium]